MNSSTTRRWRSSAAWTVAIFAILAAAVFYLLRPPALDPGEEPDGEPLAGLEDAAPPLASGERPDAAPNPGGSSATTVVEDVEPPTPLLNGTITGDGAAVPDASVILLSVDAIESSLRRLERFVPRSDSIPAIEPILSALRDEILGLRRRAATAATDASGYYEFHDLDEGGHIVLAVSPEWRFKYGDVVSIARGEERRLDLALARGESISGRVVGTDGLPRAGATVTAAFRPPGMAGLSRIIHRGLQYLNGELLRGPFVATTGADGEFEIGGLLPGVYDISAEIVDGVLGVTRGVETGRSGVIVTLGEPAQITGVVIDENGIPVSHVELRVEAEAERVQLPLAFASFGDAANTVFAALGEGPRAAETSGAGRFRFQRLEPGRYRLSCQSAGFLPHQQSVDVDWGERKEVEPITLGRGATITGVVRNPHGASLEGAAVFAIPKDVNFMNMGLVMKDVISRRVTAKTGPDGVFRLSGLVGGTYEVTATHDHHASDRHRIRAPNAEPVEFILEVGLRVSGRVRDTAGEPIAGARVRANRESTTTDGEGAFEIDGVVVSNGNSGPFWNGRLRERREIRIEASQDGFRPASVRLAEEDRLDEVELTLERAPRIRGTVVDSAGEPVPGTILRLTPELPEEFRAGVLPRFGIDAGMIFFGVTVADADGKFDFQSYRSFGDIDAIEVLATHPEFTNTRSEGIDLGGDDVDVEIRLVRGGTISGRVSDGSSPLSGATVQLRRVVEGDEEVEEMERVFGFLGLPKGGEEAYTDKNGRFVYAQVESGDYLISAAMPHFVESPEQPIRVDVDAELDLDIVVDVGEMISGAVVDAGGGPVAGARVRILREPEVGTRSDRDQFQFEKAFGGALKRTNVDVEGRFEFPGLRAGSYTVIASADGFADAEQRGVEAGGRELEFTLAAAAALVVRVRDAVDGAPLGGFTLSLQSLDSETDDDDVDFSGPWNRARSAGNADGTQSSRNLAPGEYRATVGLAGYVSASQTLELASGETATIDFDLARGISVLGTIVDAATQQPIDDAEVLLTSRTPEFPAGPDPREATPEEVAADDERALRRLWSRSDESEWSDDSNSRGEFQIRDVPLDVAAATVVHSEFVPQVVSPLVVARGEDTTLQIQLRRGYTVDGRVLDAGDDGISGRFLFLRGVDAENAHIRKTAATNGEGGFRFAGLAAGSYRILCPNRNGPPVTPLHLSVAGNRTVELRATGE